MSNIPLADLLAFGVIAACIIMSLMRGVIAEISSLITWIVAFFIAKWFAVPFSEIAFKSLSRKPWVWHWPLSCFLLRHGWCNVSCAHC